MPPRDKFPLSPPGERPRIEVRILRINADGTLDELSCFPLDYYGSCPNVGDTVVDSTLGEPKFYAVQRRYFVRETISFSGWAVIVREIDAVGPPLELWEEWRYATKLWDDVAAQEEEEFNRATDEQIRERPVVTRSSTKPIKKAMRKRVLKPRPPTK
ncbi:hypothetical protein [Rhizobium sp. HT1-10]|uniref:hypothetical protein n=1 Tax=Rhizobium sp. HT1-10 TaxID=3111638 RepID=UPI003C13BDEE